MKRKCKQWWLTMPLMSTKERFCPYRANTWISNVMCRGLYCSQWCWGERWVCWYWWNCLTSWLKDFLFIITSRITLLNIKKDHWLIKFMLCKLQHRKIERIWYLQSKKACQVVECACLNWCNLIRIQITTKYKIRTKYNENLRPNKDKESRKTTSVLPEPTYRRTKVKKRKKKRQTMVLIRKLKFQQQEPH